MRPQEFSNIVKMLRGNYGNYILADEVTMNTWYERLKNFDNGIVYQVVNDYISVESTPPKLADILERTKKADRNRLQYFDIHKEKTSKCPYCHDTGLVVSTSITGVTIGSPCRNCGLGQQRYPWEFLSEEQQQEYIADEARHGRSVPREYKADDRFYMKYVYGMEV